MQLWLFLKVKKQTNIFVIVPQVKKQTNIFVGQMSKPQNLELIEKDKRVKQ